jgi:5-amino-6-(5-phosphoribosylamino)uracil reductase/diaminohydroxyphosphoribosylaminopyrimidine deaminase/5-amino-6-(5-phosphoribosylamino)uracil reductase
MDAIGRPAVTLCYTQTLDGRLATTDGTSQWIGGPESVRLWHALRSQHDAILVGVGTVQKDNPRLTVRHVIGRDPLRVIVDSELRTPDTAAVLAAGAAHGTLLAVTDRASDARRSAVRALGATLLTLPADEDGRVDLAALLAALHRQGVGSLMVEGGAAIITSLLRARLADRVVVCIAPRLMGAGIEAIGDLGVARLAQMPAIANLKIDRYGEDLVLDGQLIYPSGSPY